MKSSKILRDKNGLTESDFDIDGFVGLHDAFQAITVRISGTVVQLDEKSAFAVVVPNDSFTIVICPFDTIHRAGFRVCRLGASIDLEVLRVIPDPRLGIARQVFSINGKSASSLPEDLFVHGSAAPSAEELVKSIFSATTPYYGAIIPEGVGGAKPSNEELKRRADALTTDELLRELNARGASRETCNHAELEINNRSRPHWLDKNKPGHLRGLTAPSFLKIVWADKLKNGKIRRELLKQFDSDLLKAVDVYMSARKSRNQDAGDATGITLIASNKTTKTSEADDKMRSKLQPKKMGKPGPRL